MGITVFVKLRIFEYEIIVEFGFTLNLKIQNNFQGSKEVNFWGN